MASQLPQTSSRRERSEMTRDRVLEVATELMAARGYSGTTISAISKASGVMPASIYWHFDSKEGLLAAVIDRAAEAWFEGAALATGEVEAAPVSETEHRQGLGYIFEERPDFFRVLMLIGLERGKEGGPPVEAVRRVRARLREKLTERLNRTLEAEGTADPHLAQRMVGYATAMLDGLFVAQQIEPLEGEALEARYDQLHTMMRVLRAAFVAEAKGGVGAAS